MSTSSDNPDAQLDALISRIHSLTGGAKKSETPHPTDKQQPRPVIPQNNPASSQPQAMPPQATMPNQPAPAQPMPPQRAPQAAPQAAGPTPGQPLTSPRPRQPIATGPQPAQPVVPNGPGFTAPAEAHPSSANGPQSPRPSAPSPGATGPAKPAANAAPTKSAAEPETQQNETSSDTPVGGPKQSLGASIEIPPGPLGFKGSRDEAWRPVEPESFHKGGINESILEAIIYRFLLTAGESEGRRVADQVKLPFRLVEPILTRLKMEQNIAYKSATATNDYVYILTETGRQIARNHSVDCTYFGACPVRLSDYINSVKYQTIEGQYPKKADLVRAFSDLLINPKMLNRLGPAVASGRGMFLFGFPGNGKTSIAERVTGAFGKYIWIPRSVDIDGDIMRVFDPMNHELAMPEESTGLLDIGGFDKRWVRIKRPTIVAGGELTMEMLEVLHNPESKISESPLQMKSNCGTLVIDDFGRQKMRVDELLNRWIIPLEKRYDFLNMASGKKIQVPFDQLVIFSTNLEPKDLVDDAFLRRIPYKIEVENPPEQDFRKLLEIMCRVVKVPYNPDAIDYLIETHYKPVNRPFRNCQPRDLLLQVRNYCLYNDLEIELKNEYLDFACDNYFSVM
ncbi:ATPase with chaperone activity [Stieleria sp. JC731]|uniref:ATPase with chaperone activity n=1 Tax=Pirellulaceae TaxID=2691357 RepID=UPI001E54C61B|nr:ATPase with chaperone activity [Stieleria sp. JC731]MCC9603791.1 ATPase with chaperone activity [Stieleria sp. JC731]